MLDDEPVMLGKDPNEVDQSLAEKEVNAEYLDMEQGAEPGKTLEESAIFNTAAFFSNVAFIFI